jgi:hypothetical protein
VLVIVAQRSRRSLRQFIGAQWGCHFFYLRVMRIGSELPCLVLGV